MFFGWPNSYLSKSAIFANSWNAASSGLSAAVADAPALLEPTPFESCESMTPVSVRRVDESDEVTVAPVPGEAGAASSAWTTDGSLCDPVRDDNVVLVPT